MVAQVVLEKGIIFNNSEELEAIFRVLAPLLTDDEEVLVYRGFSLCSAFSSDIWCVSQNIAFCFWTMK